MYLTVAFGLEHTFAVCYVAVMTVDISKVDIDLRGMLCPMTFVKLRMALDQLPAGTEISALYDASPSNQTVPSSVEALGHHVLSHSAMDDIGEKPLILIEIRTG